MATAAPERIKRVLETLKRNRGEGMYTTPTGPEGHYPGWYKWDGDFAAIAWARCGKPDEARQDLLVEAENTEPNGFIPNMVKLGSRRWWDLEPRTFLDHRKSNYSQPPVFALAAMETFKSYLASGREIEGRAFLEEIYPSVARHFRYFMNNREMEDGNPLIFVVHPHETGRDYDPTFDKHFGGFIIPVDWRNRNHLGDFAVDKSKRLINAVSGYIHRLWMGHELQNHGWSEEAGKQLCGVQDVMFNAIYAHGLGVLSEMAEITGNKNEAVEFRDKETSVSNAVFERMWDPKERVFKALDRNGRWIDTISVSNLFPLILRGISEDQMKGILNMLEDPESFGVPFPIPSVPKKDPRFDAHYEAPLIWRGTTWPPMNFYLIDQGAIPRAQEIKETNPYLASRLDKISYNVCRASAEMADNGHSEQKNPLTGLPVREKTSQYFSWGTLLDLLGLRKKYLETIRNQ